MSWFYWILIHCNVCNSWWHFITIWVWYPRCFTWLISVLSINLCLKHPFKRKNRIPVITDPESEKSSKKWSNSTARLCRSLQLSPGIRPVVMECLPALGARNFDSFVQKWPCNNNGYGYWPPVQREFPFALDRRDDQLFFYGLARPNVYWPPYSLWCIHKIGVMTSIKAETWRW